MTKKSSQVLFSIPNAITYFRLGLLYLCIYFITTLKPPLLLSTLILCPIVFLLDALDGFVARKIHQVSKLGSLLDIVGDRIVENSLWICFLYLQMVPLWVPILFITRSFLTDGIRSYAFAQGKGPFNLITSSWGKKVASSRFSRAAYGIIKALSFIFLILLSFFQVTNKSFPYLSEITYTTVYLTALFNVIRGLPVIIDGRKYLKEK